MLSAKRSSSLFLSNRILIQRSTGRRIDNSPNAAPDSLLSVIARSASRMAVFAGGVTLNLVMTLRPSRADVFSAVHKGGTARFTSASAPSQDTVSVAPALRAIFAGGSTIVAAGALNPGNESAAVPL